MHFVLIWAKWSWQLEQSLYIWMKGCKTIQSDLTDKHVLCNFCFPFYPFFFFFKKAKRRFRRVGIDGCFLWLCVCVHVYIHTLFINRAIWSKDLRESRHERGLRIVHVFRFSTWRVAMVFDHSKRVAFYGEKCVISAFLVGKQTLLNLTFSNIYL